MFKKAIQFAVMTAFLATAACSTQTAYIDKKESQDGVKLSNDAFKGQNLGAIKAEDGGAIWDKCDEKAEGSLRELAHKAKSMGANAVGDIRWTATKSSEPSCKKGWGYLVIWPFILTPLLMSTQVTGVAYKTTGARAGLFMLPNNQAEEDAFVKQVLASMK